MNRCKQLEVGEDYINAIICYEDKIAENLNILDNFINLSFLYWCLAFELFEFNLPNDISESWSTIGGERYNEIINIGLSKFPQSLELKFWKKYFNHISNDDIFTFHECLSLINEHKEDLSLVPYFFLYLFDKDRYEEKKVLLLDNCLNEMTAKNIYIKSILSSS